MSLPLPTDRLLPDRGRSLPSMFVHAEKIGMRIFAWPILGSTNFQLLSPKKWRVECSSVVLSFFICNISLGWERDRQHAEKPIWNEGVCWFENENPVNFSPFYSSVDDELTDKLLKRKGTKVRCLLLSAGILIGLPSIRAASSVANESSCTHRLSYTLNNDQR